MTTPHGPGFMQLRIDGPRGSVVKAQIRGNLSQLRHSWMRDTWLAGGEFVRRVAMARQFRDLGAYLGGGWRPLSRPYLDWKIRGGWLEPIGQRTGAMIAALTGEARPFTMAGPFGPVLAKPILEADADGVVIGADVTEKGNEYTRWFDKVRPVFGTGRMPALLEMEFGKLLSLPFLAALRTREIGDPEIDAASFPRREVSRYIAERTLRNLA